MMACRRSSFLLRQTVLHRSMCTSQAGETVATDEAATSSSSNAGQKLKIIPNKQVYLFVDRCLKAVNTRKNHAAAVAENLVDADYRGFFSQGLNKLPTYVQDVKSGMTVSHLDPEILRETSATAHVDGNNLLGPVVGNFCMDLAIRKAKEAGIGWIIAKRSNHYGIAAHFAMKASNIGMLGMSFTNGSPSVVPTRGKRIEMCVINEQTLPGGWGVDSNGDETYDPNIVMTKGGLLPIGGTESSCGYKGYGLGMMVEIFCGILGGANFSTNIRPWKSVDQEANLGQCFIVINPDCFDLGFADRLQELLHIQRSQEKAEHALGDVMVAGDRERKHMKLCDGQGGIAYSEKHITVLDALAKQLKVRPIEQL